IVTGDLLFSRAFAELTRNQDLAQLRTLSDATSALAAGELLQREDAFVPHVAVERYLRRCELKTDALFEAACRLGALTAATGAATAGGRAGRRRGPRRGPPLRALSPAASGSRSKCSTTSWMSPDLSSARASRAGRTCSRERSPCHSSSRASASGISPRSIWPR